MLGWRRGRTLVLLALLFVAFQGMPAATSGQNTCPPTSFGEIHGVGAQVGFVSIAEGSDWFLHTSEGLGNDFLYSVLRQPLPAQSIALSVYNSADCALLCRDFGNGLCLSGPQGFSTSVWIRIAWQSTATVLGGVDYVLTVTPVPE